MTCSNCGSKNRDITIKIHICPDCGEEYWREEGE